MVDNARHYSDRDLSRQVLDSLAAEVAVVDSSGTIIAVNEAWSRFATENGGAAEASGVGVNYLSVCRSAAGKDALLATQACCGIEEVLNGTRAQFTLEYPCHSPNDKRWFLLYVSRLKADEAYVVTTHLSITERKLAEQRLVVAERLAAIGEAMQGLTHEGRNALQRGQACIEMLRLHLRDDAEALDLLERIAKAQVRLLDLYEEVSSYAAPMTLRHEPCRLNELVDEVWQALALRCPEASFSSPSCRDDLTCEIDTSTIRQLLKSVLKNALVAGGELPRVEVVYVEDQLEGMPALTIIVSDNGPGIPQEDWERVFEPFYTTKTRGTGLGLAVSKRIVAAHGGHIYFGTPQHQGASVYITLPIHQRSLTG